MGGPSAATGVGLDDRVIHSPSGLHYACHPDAFGSRTNISTESPL